MKILETDKGWALEHNGKNVAIEGESYFTDRAVLETLIEARKMHVWSDGTVNREPEKRRRAPAPPTQDPPKDPDADKDRPKPKAKAPAKKTATTAEPKRAGRPRKYTPEEALERRRQQKREYIAKRSPEKRAEEIARAKAWREANPDKVQEVRKRSAANRAARYHDDPEFKKKYDEYQRQYKRAKRAEKKEQG